MSQPSTKGYATLIAPPLNLQTKRQLLGSLVFITFIFNIVMAIATFLGFTISQQFEYTLSLSVLEAFLWVAWLAIVLGIEESAFFFFAFAFGIINLIFEIIQFAWRIYLISGESIFDFPILFQFLSSWGIIIGNFFVIFFNIIIFMYIVQIKILIIAYYEDVIEKVNDMIRRADNSNIRRIIAEEEEDAPPPSAPPLSKEEEDYFLISSPAQSSQHGMRSRRPRKGER